MRDAEIIDLITRLRQIQEETELLAPARSFDREARSASDKLLQTGAS